MIRIRKRTALRISLIAALAIACIIAAWLWWNTSALKPGAPIYTVDQVYENGASLLGKRIAVRGSGVLLGVSNDGDAIGSNCVPDFFPESAFLNSQENNSRILIPDVKCTGDNCEMHCAPVSWLGGFELVGVLSGSSSVSLFLKDIEWNRSSRLFGDGDLMMLRRAPLETGEYIIIEVVR